MRRQIPATAERAGIPVGTAALRPYVVTVNATHTKANKVKSGRLITVHYQYCASVYKAQKKKVSLQLNSIYIVEMKHEPSAHFSILIY